jgi:hypothetical protein
MAFCQEIFFLKSRSDFKSDFSRVGVADFPSGDCEVKTSQNSILDQNIFKLREENLKGELGPPLQHRPCLCGLKKVIAF